MNILFLNCFKNKNRPHFFWGLHENISGHKKRRLESLLKMLLLHTYLGVPLLFLAVSRPRSKAFCLQQFVDLKHIRLLHKLKNRHIQPVGGIVHIIINLRFLHKVNAE